MAMNGSEIPLNSWRRQDDTGRYLISTDLQLLDREFINRAYARDDMYWARPLSPEQMDIMLRQSQTLGLFRIMPYASTNEDSPSSPRTPSPTVGLESTPEENLEQIGMARFVTDYVTTTYLTDVFVDPEYRGRSLSTWLIACCREVISQMPALRRAVLFASPDVGKKFYSRALGFHDAEEERARLVILTKRGFDM